MTKTRKIKSKVKTITSNPTDRQTNSLGPKRRHNEAKSFDYAPFPGSSVDWNFADAINQQLRSLRFQMPESENESKSV